MLTARRLVAGLTALVLSVPVVVAIDSAVAAPAPRAGDDAVVIAVIDSGFAPYHRDFLASQMPQAKTAGKADDLPLDKAPHTWLNGFPKPAAFDEYRPVRLSLTDKADAKLTDLVTKDKDVWSEVARSKSSALNYSWIPGTKVIGAMTFEIGRAHV